MWQQETRVFDLEWQVKEEEGEMGTEGTKRTFWFFSLRSSSHIFPSLSLLFLAHSFLLSFLSFVNHIPLPQHHISTLISSVLLVSLSCSYSSRRDGYVNFSLGMDWRSSFHPFFLRLSLFPSLSPSLSLSLSLVSSISILLPLLINSLSISDCLPFRFLPSLFIHSLHSLLPFFFPDLFGEWFFCERDMMLFVRCVIYGLCLFRDPFQLLLSSPLFSAFPSLFFPPGFDHHHMKTKKSGKKERKREREQEENDDQWKHRKQSNIWKEREREIIIMRNGWRRSSCPSGRKAYFIVKWRNEGKREWRK